MIMMANDDVNHNFLIKAGEYQMKNDVANGGESAAVTITTSRSKEYTKFGATATTIPTADPHFTNTGSIYRTMVARIEETVSPFITSRATGSSSSTTTMNKSASSSPPPSLSSLLILLGGVIYFFLTILSIAFPTLFISEFPEITVAYIGNSMQYYNDMPRFMTALSDNHIIKQNSCLHGGATFSSLLTSGNGMFTIWDNGMARVNVTNMKTYDYGACTVQQLLFGYDENLETKMEQQQFNGYYSNNNDDDNENDDFYNYYDGKNPCYNDPYYYKYLTNVYYSTTSINDNVVDDDVVDDDAYNDYEDNDDDSENDDGYNYDDNNYITPKWDFIVMNDQTRHAARTQPRLESLETLEQVYVPWLIQTGAIPILLCTYPYQTQYRDMTGLDDVPTFASLTYEGYKQYANVLEQNLPEKQKPRIANVALGFLTVYEENYNLYLKLFHIDEVHPSPSGTYLQGLIVHYTIFGKMPKKDVAIPTNAGMSSLWNTARRMAPRKHTKLPFPSFDDALYLYNVAERICLHGHIPKSFVFYNNGESIDYTPNDEYYENDDIY